MDSIVLKTKAEIDLTRCLACARRFGSDDVRSNVYNDDGKIIGCIHEDEYELLVIRVACNTDG